MERQEGNVDAVWKFIRKQKRVVVWVKFSPRSNRNMCSNVQIWSIPDCKRICEGHVGGHNAISEFASDCKAEVPL